MPIARQSRPALLAGVLLALAASGAPAWGPFTHVAIGKAVLERIRANPESQLSFLDHEPYRSIFLAASMGPDMTFSTTGFGKTDKMLDMCLHDRKLSRRLVEAGLEHGGPAAVAFGLGWHAHIVADTVMCRSGSVIYKNVFELQPDTLHKLGSDVPGMLKVAIDAIKARQDPWILGTLPRIDVPALEKALRATASGKVGGGNLEEQLTDHAESFAGAVATLREVSRTLGANTRAFPALVSELTGAAELKSARVPGLAESAKAIHAALARMVPAAHQVGEEPGEVPEAMGSPGFLNRLAASLTRRGRQLLAGDGVASRMTRGALDAALSAMNTLGIGRERTRRARVMATFLGEMLSGKKDWPRVKAAVRQVAEDTAKSATADEDVPQEAPTDEEAPLDGAP